jgi:predicted Zn-dependent protease
MALSLAKDDPQWIRTNARGEMAASLYALSEPAEAIAVLKAALEEDPNDSGLWGALAVMSLGADLACNSESRPNCTAS